MSAVGGVIKGSNTGMSMFLAIAALGGIITPQIIGVVADNMGMVAAIVILALNATGMLIMALVNMKINRQRA